MKSIKTKLLVSFLLVSLLPLTILGIFAYTNSKDALVESKKEHLKQLVDSAYIMAENLQMQVDAGALSEEEAQEAFRVTLIGEKQADNTRLIPADSPRIGQDDYFFAYNKEIRAVMHPMEFEGEIKNDPNVEGIHVNREMYEQKEGYYSFMWQNPGEDSARPKIAYLRYFEPWDWVIVMGSYYDAFYKESEQMRNISIFIFTAGLIIVIAVSLFISTRFTNNIQKMKSAVEALGEGDFTKRVHILNKDEIGSMGETLNEATEQMRQMFSEVNHSSDNMKSYAEELMTSTNEIREGIEQVSSTTEELAAGSTDQAENASETLEKIQQVDREVKQINQYTEEMTNRSQITEDSSQKGIQSAEQSMHQMKMIEEKVSSAAYIVKELGEKSKEINQILEVINDIASQTNLLSLNAAIEAARAGERGRGFAVVADEVRKLAEQSAQSTGEIANIIEMVQKESAEAEKAMTEVVQEVQSGTKVIDNNRQAFNEIAQNITDMISQINKVTAASELINQEINEAVNDVENIAAISQESSAGTEELSATMEEQNASMQEIDGMANNLAQMAESLNQLLAKFKYERE